MSAAHQHATHSSTGALHEQKHLRIGIIGAGPAGMAVALALQQRGFQRVRVYERDAAIDTRAQGCTGPFTVSVHVCVICVVCIGCLADAVGLKNNQGLDVLRALGLESEFDTFCRSFGDPYRFSIRDFKGSLLHTTSAQVSEPEYNVQVAKSLGCG